MPAVETFSVPSVGLTMVDFENSLKSDRLAGLEILWVELQGFLNRIRPGVTLCNPAREGDACDAELGIYSFVVWARLDIIGAFNLYNVKEETSTQRKIEISGMAAPGVQSTRTHTKSELWSAIMRHMLENDLEEADGRIVDLVQWDFPEVVNHRWYQDEIADDIVSDLVTAGHTVDSSEGYPRKARRVDRRA